MSNSVWPHGLQPTRLLHPWDSPGKNTGVGCHFLLQCMKVESESEVTQSCLTLSDPMDCSPPGSSIHGIFWATVLEWGCHCLLRWQSLDLSISLQMAQFHSFYALLSLPSRFSCVRLCATPWTAAYQASPSMGFSRQEHWSGLPFPSPMHESGKWKWSRSVVSDS